MYCYNCGKEANDKAVVCVSCGVVLANSPLLTEPAKDEKKSSFDWLFQFLAIISCVFVFIIRNVSLTGYESGGHIDLFISDIGVVFMLFFAAASLVFGILAFVFMFKRGKETMLAPVLAFSLSICAFIVAILSGCGI